ncbi:DUF4173 domain-containing protein [Paenibacillus sp. FSL W8-0426]|uniref:DUF4153 domain-containing protein n=1 Tax=Paenibacillus sp. FSL W8-0426 TaxID=2921714 RepID=UPI0030D9C82D
MIENMLSSPKRAPITLLAAIVLAILHQYLFFEKTPGISYPLFVILFYGFMLSFAKDRLRAKTYMDLFFAGSILLLSLTLVLFDNPLFRILNVMAVPGLVSLHMAYLLGRKKRNWWEPGLIGTALDHLLPQSIRHWKTLVLMASKTGGKGKGINRSQKAIVLKILAGLAISFPILIIVLSLLSSADGIFSQLVSGIPQWLDQLSFGEGFPRIVWVVVASLLFFGYVWGFVQPMTYEAEKRENAHWKNGMKVYGPMPLETGTETDPAGDAATKKAVAGQFYGAQSTNPQPVKLDPLIMGTILVVINSVYVLFVFVQFAYLFGAGEGNLPSGMTYAEYARSGFAELVLVTGINFVILTIALQFTNTVGSVGTRVHQVLLFITVGCSAIMLYSAFARLLLYEQAYGYTYIRFLVHAFMIFLAFLLLIASLRIVRTTFPMWRWVLALSLTAYVAVNYVGMDRIIAERNIERYHQSGDVDASYLAGLSADAVPLLSDFARKENEELKALLLERRQQLEADGSVHSWPSFNIAKYRALHELQTLAAEE